VVRGAVRAIPVVLLLAFLGTSCGSPGYTYVKSSKNKTYFKVPAQWHKIDDAALSKVLNGNPDSATARVQKQIVWTVAYDAAKEPSVMHLTGLPSDDPVVLAMVRPLTQAEQGQVSLDALRNLGGTVTAEARQAAAQQGTTDDSFEWLRDQVLKPGGGLRGVREVYNSSPNPVSRPLTTDRTVLASDDGHLYLFVIRCSAHCYRTRASELDAIARSFTVRNIP
jgi:hypothetical protein